MLAVYVSTLDWSLEAKRAKERLGLEKLRYFQGIDDDQSTFHDDASLASITSGVKAINI